MTTETGSGQLVRALTWKGAFWVAAGVPPLVLFFFVQRYIMDNALGSSVKG